VAVIEVERHDERITEVRLHRPERLNAMSIELVTELHDTLEAVAADNACRVVILTGSGRAFCSGLDLKDHGLVPGIDGLQVGQIAQKAMWVYSRLTPLMRSMPQPVIAAVNGDAYGGGMCLALAADLRFAAAGARFNATGIVNGLTSTEMGASWLLPRLVGAAHSNDLLLTGRVVDADEAYRMGLVSRVLATPEDLAAEALATAERIAGFSRYGVAMTKSTAWANLEIGSLAAAQELEDRNQLMLGFTDNLPEAMRAFAEDRPPVYRDEPRKDLYGPG
jgi:enoyl-CoA hydratase